MSRSSSAKQNGWLTSEQFWAAVGILCVIAGSACARKLMEGGWRKTMGCEPPLNPDDEESTWVQSLGWGLASGAIVGLARTLSHKGASAAQRRWG